MAQAASMLNAYRRVTLRLFRSPIDVPVHLVEPVAETGIRRFDRPVIHQLGKVELALVVEPNPCLRN